MYHSTQLLASLLFPVLLSAQFNVGESVRILQEQKDDLYLAGGEVSVDAHVQGDVLITGGKIVLNDPVGEDVTVAGGQINVNGRVGDDVRVAGGKVIIDCEVMDDVIVFGGYVEITRNAIVRGDLVSFSGEISMNGQVLGALKASGGEVKLNGVIRGPSEIRAGDIEIGDVAELHNDVRYWTEDGKIDFGNAMKAGTATYDAEMGWEDDMENWEEEGHGKGFGWFGAIMMLVSGFILILLLNWAFGKWLGRAAKNAEVYTARSLGQGVLYWLLFPLAILVCFITVIGIPVGVIFLLLFIISIALAHVIVALTVAHWLNNRKGGNWSFLKVSLIALGIAVAVRLATMIPWIGFLISMVVVSIAFGALIIAVRNNRRETAPVVGNE